MSNKVAVIGLGAHGSAILHRLSEQGVSVIGFDRFSPPHEKGSHGGETRITREAQREGVHLTSIIQAGNEWRQKFEIESDRPLFVNAGFIQIYPTGSDRSLQLREVAENARKQGVKTRFMDASQVRKKWPCFNIQSNEEALHEPGAGYLNANSCIALNLRMAAKHGAEIRLDAEIKNIRNGEIIIEGGEIVKMDQIALSTGAYIKRFLTDGINRNIKPVRALISWFDIVNNYEHHRDAPTFIWKAQDGKAFYGSPAIDGPEGGMKIGVSKNLWSNAEVDPNDHSSDISNSEIRNAYGDIKELFPGLSNDFVRATACMFTMTSDEEFIIDRHPYIDGVWVCSPCSGHGFKLSHGIGVMMTELLKNGRSTLWNDAFRLNRFG